MIQKPKNKHHAYHVLLAIFSLLAVARKLNEAAPKQEEINNLK